MNDKEKLVAILQRAFDNGWKRYLSSSMEYLVYDYEGPVIEEIIFSKDFAKAFWGEGEVCEVDGNKYPCIVHTLTGNIFTVWVPAWEHYLQQLVLQDNYIDYLYSFIKEGE